MNQGRIWTVVSPSVGLPLMLGSVAITSLLVHAAVLTHTTWMGGYWQGGKAKTAELVVPSKVASAVPGYSVNVAPVAAEPGKSATAFVVTVTPDQARPAVLAMASTQ